MMHFKFLRKKIFNPKKIYVDDVFLVSYPKSGNTWLRFMLAYCLHDIESESVDFHNIQTLIPDIYVGWPTNKKTRPRIMKSHEPYTPRYPRVIYLYRDGRDVIVSYYYHSIQRNQFDGTLYEFITEFNSAFGSWGGHVRGWLDREDITNTYGLSYEHLKENPFVELSNLLNFIGVKVSTARIKSAIRLSSFDNMRSIEKNKGLPSYLNANNQDFVRKGNVGGWKTELDIKALDSFMEQASDTLFWLGYK